MTTIKDIMDKVDVDLLNLINANDCYMEYRKIAPITTSAEGLHLSGSLGIEINPKRPLGLTISQRV